MIETTDGQTSISTITMMDEQTSLNYLNINPNLPYEALPFTLSPMDGMDDGDGDDGQGNSEINAALTDNWASSLNDYSTPEFSTVPALIAGALEPIPATPVKAEDCG